jgi:hypothetical protein
MIEFSKDEFENHKIKNAYFKQKITRIQKIDLKNALSKYFKFRKAHKYIIKFQH